MSDHFNSKAREWDSTTYHRISAPQFDWGKKVVARVTLRGHESVLDAGCGTGRLTEELVQLLPNGRVVGVDLSQNMLKTASQQLRPRFRNHITFVAADLANLPFRAAFDGMFSTATFHWVRDHDQLFRSLYDSLRAGRLG